MTAQRDDAIYWMHDDALVGAPAHCVHACYVFDPAAIRYHGYGMQRLGFIYETLIELPVEIYHGETVTTLLELARRSGATRVIAWSTPCPWITHKPAGRGGCIGLGHSGLS